MNACHRRLLFAVGLLAGLAAPSPAEDVPTGSVNGPAMEVLIREVQEARLLEEAAEAMLAPYLESQAPPPPEVKDSFDSAMEQAMDLLLGVLGEPALKEDAGLSRAVENLEDAMGRDAEILSYVSHGSQRSTGALFRLAEKLKRDAQFLMMGVKLVGADELYLPANPPPPTAAVDPDIKSQRKANKVTKKDIAEGLGDSLRGRGKARREPKPGPGSSKAKAAGPPPNWFYSFTGTSKTETGYLFKSLDRPLFGPFEVKFQVGAFDPNAEGDTGSACVEFDVEGSSPLQFLAVCGRRVSGGVQVFAQSHDGAAGNLFLAGARIAQVRVFYDGATFTCSAAEGAGAPDEALVDFATYGLVQGETALLPGIGASGLLKGAEIGLDEIYFTAK